MTRKRLKINVDEIINSLNVNDLKKYSANQIREFLNLVNELGMINACKRLNISKSTARYWIHNSKLKEEQKTYYHRNPNKQRQYASNSYNKNKKVRRLKQKKYNKKHPEVNKKWLEKNPNYMPDYLRKYEKERMTNDPNYALLRRLRDRTRKAILEQLATKQGPTIELLGADIPTVRKHIESLFLEGMSWDNHGEWHIDHIKPCASFDLTDSEQQKECFNYTNLQPLWAVDNLSKGDKT